jgi:hypothetical protein
MLNFSEPAFNIQLSMVFRGVLGLTSGVIPAFIDHLAKSLAQYVCSGGRLPARNNFKCKEMMTATCLLFY